MALPSSLPDGVANDETLRLAILEALNAIIDPCSAAAGVPAGLVDMGLVREAAVTPLDDGGYRAIVRISVTHPFCLMAAVFLGDVEKRIRALPGVREVASSVDSTVIWRPEMQSAAYRDRLAAHRNQRRVASVPTKELMEKVYD